MAPGSARPPEARFVNPDKILSLAGSKDVAFLLSLFVNVALVYALKRVYQAKERLHGQITEFLKVLLPLAIRIKGEK